MQDTDLFQMALGLFPPWLVERCTFDPEQKQTGYLYRFFQGRRVRLSRMRTSRL